MLLLKQNPSEGIERGNHTLGCCAGAHGYKHKHAGVRGAHLRSQLRLCEKGERWMEEEEAGQASHPQHCQLQAFTCHCQALNKIMGV